MELLLVDWFSIAIISAFGVAGFFNGFAKEIFSAAAWIISILGAWYFGPLLFPYIDPYISNAEVKSIASFVALFIILFTLLRLSGAVTSKFLSALGLGFLDKGFGFVFGALKATAILVSVFMLASGFLENQSWWVESLSKEWTLRIAEIMEPILKDWKAQAEILLNKENVTFPPSL
ncbi:MAG: CvpA family protein [SAR86 cluster bacterium]|jgi:membrane protein required for colicin V production|nr:CvpA family protein [SAR86 cluster bacterium]HIC26838.1 CvpA family protein [Gammaproteobacteria bacterium]